MTTDVMPRFGTADIDLVRKEAAFQGYFRIDRYTLRHRLMNGGWSKEITRELFERGHAVAVLPYDPVRDEVVLIRQFRVGPYAAGDPAWTIEVPAGIIEDGESPAEVGARELEEEAGLRPIGALERLMRCFVSPGGTSETFELYIGRVDTTGAGGVFGLEDEGEDIQVIVWPLAEALAAIADGRIVTVPAIIAVQWLALHRAELRRRWG
jgi:ADP-ribose pyrophosphatase